MIVAQAPPATQTAIAFSALRHRDYQKYFPASTLSMVGDQIEHVISYWVIFQQFHSPALAGFAVFSHWLPFLLFSFYAGALADRFDCRRLVQIGQTLFMLASLSWGLLFLTGRLQVWHAVVILTIHGFAGAIVMPAEQMILYDIVGPQHLQSAVRLAATGRQLAITLGPAIGGGILYLLGPAVGLLTNVLIYLPYTVMMWVLPYTGHTRQHAQARGPSGLGLREAGAIVREVSRDRRILIMILLGGASALFVGNAFQAQMPEYAHDFGTDDSGLRYSVLLAANAAGALSGALLLESTGLLPPKVRTALITSALWSVAIGLFPLAPSYGVGLAFLVAAGMLNITFLSMAQTLVQILAPVSLRGRVIGLYSTAQFGLRMGSGMTVGVLGSFIGVHWSLALSAAAFLLVALGLLIYDGAARRRA